MKKTIFGLMLLLLVGSVLADDTIDVYTPNGAPYPYTKERDGLFTTVGNMVCSQTPDSTSSGQANTNQLCFINQNTYPQIYQAFHLTSQSGTVDYSLGQELTLQPGEQKCFAVPRKGDYYYRQIFNCDVPQKTCAEVYPYYTKGCDYSQCDAGEVLRERALKELTPGGCSGWATQACIPDDLEKMQCDGSSGNTKIPPGASTGGQPPSPTPLRGEWQNVAVPPVATPGAQFDVFVRFQAAVAGTYYLEAGFPDKTFSIQATQSQCDGSTQWAGKYIALKADEYVDMQFSPIAPTKEGTYQFVLGAYTGCLSDGGVDVSKLTEAVQVTSDPGSAPKNEALLWAGTTIGMVALIFLVLVAGGLGLYFLMKKR